MALWAPRNSEEMKRIGRSRMRPRKGLPRDPVCNNRTNSYEFIGTNSSRLGSRRTARWGTRLETTHRFMTFYGKVGRATG
jgi:hypothetical protein